MQTTTTRDRRIQAMNARSHRANVEAAAAADRHARDFTAMFSITAPVEALKPTAAYLADVLAKNN